MPILYQSIVPEKSPKNLMPNKFAMSDGETDPLNSTNIAFKTDAIKNFHKEEELIQVPPEANMRLFNEHDVLGDCDRDDKANVIVHGDKNGNNCDKSRNPTNQRGYLINQQTGDVLENI